MPDQKSTDVPDTATTYERAKPEEESPAGTLTQPPAKADEKADLLKDNAAPSTPPPAKK